MSPWSTWTPSWTTKLGISSLLLIIVRMLKSWTSHGFLNHSDVFHGLLKPFCLTWLYVLFDVMSYQVEVQVLIVGCNNHRVDEES